MGKRTDYGKPEMSMKDIPILNERPEGMDFAEYKQRLSAQRIMIKLYKRIGRWRLK